MEVTSQLSELSVTLVLSITFLATFIRSALGFGDALIAMPLLALILGMQTATPLVALIASTIAVAILFDAWRSVDVSAAWRLVLSSLAGIPFGLFFLTAAPESLVKGVLGLVLIAFGLYNLAAPRLPTLHDERSSYLFGFVAGVLGGAYNTNGPPVVAYGALRRWPPASFRATLQGYFLPTGLTITISHGLAGLWTPKVLHLFLFTVPVTLLAVWLGGRANRSLSGDRFNRVIYAFLVLFGVLLLV